MQTTRLTRSSVLGKRAHQRDASAPVTSDSTSCDQLQTPDPTPNSKKPRTSITIIDGESNKENVPPFSPEVMNVDVSSPRATRALRRTTTEFVTPPRPRNNFRRHVSTSTTISSPATEKSHVAIITPPPTPLSFTSLHARARALLRPTSNDDYAIVAGRDAERTLIHEFLTAFLENSGSSTEGATCTNLYISGSPGTGKTALVNSVLHTLVTDARVVYINCMALSGVDTLWDRLIEELESGVQQKSPRKGKKVKGREAVQALLLNYETKCIFVLDELDHIASTSQLLTSVFSLVDVVPSTLRLIGIANTHTLTSSLSASPALNSNVRTLHFAPYTPTQLLDIVQSRLAPLSGSGDDKEKNATEMKKFLPQPTLLLVTKKIAALTGDVRSLFEVLRGAIDLAVVASVSSNSPTTATDSGNSLETPPPVVTPNHILAALKAYKPSSIPSAKTTTSTPVIAANSEIVAKISSLGLQARLVILCTLLASSRLDAGLGLTSMASAHASPTKKTVSPVKRSSSLPVSNGASVAGIDANQLHAYYTAVLQRTDNGVFDPVSRSEFADLIGVLEGVGLVSLGGTADITPSRGGAKRAFGRSASFAGSTGFGGSGRGKGKGDVKLVQGVRAEEVLRGLGITNTPAVNGDVCDEEVRGIWEREKARLGRDAKARSKESDSAAGSRRFEAAFED